MEKDKNKTEEIIKEKEEKSFEKQLSEKYKKIYKFTFSIDNEEVPIYVRPLNRKEYRNLMDKIAEEYKDIEDKEEFTSEDRIEFMDLLFIKESIITEREDIDDLLDIVGIFKTLTDACYEISGFAYDKERL